ncbi:hypothetical protein GCM10023069_24100 [Shinella granuli]
MQLIEVPAKQGYVWLRQGAWLFRKNPIGFLLLLFIYLFAVNLLMLLVPPVGVFAILLVNPAIFVGFMSACRDTVAGKRVGPASLIAGFGRMARMRCAACSSWAASMACWCWWSAAC